MPGMIFAVCTSLRGGIPKFPVSSAKVGSCGLVGDYHNREFRPSFKDPTVLKVNTRHLTLLAKEVIEELNQKLGLTLGPGSLGENITTKFLGDLSQIADNTRVRLGARVVIRVIEQNHPCRNLAPLHRLLVKTIYGRRGLLCAIEEGFGEELKPLDSILLL